MNKMWTAPAVLACGFVIVASAFGQEIHLKTRTISTASEESTSRPAPASRIGSRKVHQIVQFSHPAGAADIAALVNAGAEVVSSLPDNALVVSSPEGLTVHPAGVTWMGRLQAHDKISPALARPAALKTSGATLTIVEFHSDIDAAQQKDLETALGVTFQRPAGLMAKHVIVEATPAELKTLSEQDEVAYMFPADPALLNGTNTYPCAGMLTTAGTVAQYANVTQGWDLDSDKMAHLTYYFGSLTAKVPAATVKSEILRAMSEWEAVANVAFDPSAVASTTRSIYIEFASGSHGDAYSFDGPGGMLAHTFYPAPSNPEPIAGDMHFDADEAWKVGADTDIYTVALHELGHAIGLTHSDNPGDVMYPYYQRGTVLSPNDIGAAKELYPVTTALAPSVPVTAVPAPVTTTVTTTAATPTTPVSTGTTVSAPAPLTLTLDPVASTTSAATITVTGIATGGSGGNSIEWRTDRGYTGTVSVSGWGAWTVSGIPLVVGLNTLTLNAVDAAGDISTRTATVTMEMPVTVATLPIAITITTPVCAVTTVNAPTVSVSGKATGGDGITKVTWQTSTGASGVATGTTIWAVTGVPLAQGTTTIFMRAYDAKGASAWVATVVVRP